MHVTFITATVFNALKDSACGSTYWDEGRETIDQAKATAKQLALDAFNEDYDNAVKVIFNINRVEMPELVEDSFEDNADAEDI